MKFRWKRLRPFFFSNISERCLKDLTNVLFANRSTRDYFICIYPLSRVVESIGTSKSPREYSFSFFTPVTLFIPLNSSASTQHHHHRPEIPIFSNMSPSLRSSPTSKTSQPGRPRPSTGPARSRGHPDIRQTKEYKLAARRYGSTRSLFLLAPSSTSDALLTHHTRWTSTIVALPIVLYTSYILYERRESIPTPLALHRSFECQLWTCLVILLLTCLPPLLTR